MQKSSKTVKKDRTTKNINYYEESFPIYPIKQSLEKICDIFSRIEDTITTNPNSVNLNQLYKLFLVEIDKIKYEMTKISKKNEDSIYQNSKSNFKVNDKESPNIKIKVNKSQPFNQNNGINLGSIKMKYTKLSEEKKISLLNSKILKKTSPKEISI